VVITLHGFFFWGGGGGGEKGGGLRLDPPLLEKEKGRNK